MFSDFRNSYMIKNIFINNQNKFFYTKFFTIFVV